MPFYIIKLGSCTTLRDEARDRLKKAVQDYEKKKRLLSILQATRLYIVSKTTLYNRIHGHWDQASYSIIK